MAWSTRIRTIWNDVRHRDRRVWEGTERAHVEVRPFPPDLTASLSAALEARLTAVPGVAWARLNAPLRRVVVQRDARARTEDLFAAVHEVERRFGLEGAFAEQERSHPADREPRVRAKVELGADVLGIVAGTGLRLARVDVLPVEIDLAAAVSGLDHIPAARRLLVERLGAPTVDLLLGLASATTSALVQGAAGPGVDILRRWQQLAELETRGRVWIEREAELCGRPSAHELARGERLPRPVPLPDGAVERYSELAATAALGGLGLGIASSERLEHATAPIFGGIPKPARLGRDAFVTQLGRLLGERGVLVLGPGGLALLDRVDRVVTDAEALLAPSSAGSGRDPEARALVAAIRRAGFPVIVAADASHDVAWARPDRVVTRASAAVTELQLEGHVVACVGAGTSPLLPAADVAIGVTRSDAPTPFHAHVLCRSGLRDARVVIASMRAAREASTQSVQMAMVEAATGLLLALGGVRTQTLHQVITASNAASLLAIGNAVRLAHGIEGPPPAAPGHERRPWHALSAEETLRALGTREGGLSTAEVEARRPPASRDRTRAQHLAELVVEELTNPLTPVLAAGAGLSALTGSMADAAMISGVVALNTLVGATQRYRTERELAALDRDEQRPVRVRRAGVELSVERRALVVGDVLLLGAGEVVPADARVVGAKALEVDESSLTGESLPVSKDAGVCLARAVADRRSMLYAGTTIAAGEVTAVVTATGPETEAERGTEGEGRGAAGGVEARLERLTALTAPAAALSGLAVIGLGMIRGQPPRDLVSAGVSLAVAAVPEGLPLLATMAQLAAAKRLAERGALVRNPRAIEALGRLDVLCADKTGTLTEGRIQLAVVSDGERSVDAEALPHSHRKVLAIALRATPPSADGERLPHLTDQALAEGAARLGVEPIGTSTGAVWTPGEDLPFEPARAFHAVVGRVGDKRVLCAKGAPEAILPRCAAWRRDEVDQPLDAAGRRELAAEAVALAGRGLRVLAVADRLAHETRAVDDARVRGLRFRGFVGLADPVRPSARGAIADLRRAGVEVVMITGDHPATAAAVARELGLDGEGCVLTGPEIELLDAEELAERASRVRVFARVTPSQKVRLVMALRAAGRVVGMTGDGANDAQAIRLADVGVAVGERSTAAARHAADLVVVDERIETLVEAVLEGRGLWRSVRDAVALLVGGNLGEIGFTLLGGLVSGRSPLNARQLLLVNLLTDTLPALAIALRPPTSTSPEELLREGPERSLGKALERDIAWRGAVTAATTSAAWLSARALGTRARADTVGLLSLVGSQLAMTLVAGGRSRLVTGSMLASLAATVAVVETPGLSHFFGCRPLGPLGLAQATAASVAAAGLATVAPTVLARLGLAEDEVEVAEPEPQEAQPSRRRAAATAASAVSPNRS